MMKKIIATSAIAFALTAGAAFAQTTGNLYPTTSTGTTGTTGASSTVGVPNTGAGGNAAENLAVLGGSLAVAGAAVVALMGKRKAI